MNDNIYPTPSHEIGTEPVGKRLRVYNLPDALTSEDALFLVQELQRWLHLRNAEQFTIGCIIAFHGLTYRFIGHDAKEGIYRTIRLRDGWNVNFTSTLDWEPVAGITTCVPGSQKIVSGDTFRYQGSFYQFRGEKDGVFHARRITPKEDVQFTSQDGWELVFAARGDQ